MLLTITSRGTDAEVLSYLLHKHPQKIQSFNLSYGKAHVFYPRLEEECCEVCLMLEVDPIGMVRNRKGPSGDGFKLDQYVNDRPYAASSFMSVAISQVFGSALNGKCKDRPEAIDRSLSLEARIEVLPVRQDAEDFLKRLFQPLGYEIDLKSYPLNDRFAEWGDSPYNTVTLKASTSVQTLLQHLYVLIPVLDNDKHYWVGTSEVDKLLAKGEGWLSEHPERELIMRRYLKYQKSLMRSALERLTERDEDESKTNQDEQEEQLEKPLSLHQQRHDLIIETLLESGVSEVVDMGCAQGRLIKRLMKEKQFRQIIGMDVSIAALESAELRLKLDRMPERQRQRLELLHGSLMYRDERLREREAVCLVEVIEHLDAPRLQAMEANVFGWMKANLILLTTPNIEYNALFEGMKPGQFRHRDHRFEWSRSEFESWANAIAEEYDYRVTFKGIGEVHQEFGSPTQMAIFEKES